MLAFLDSIRREWRALSPSWSARLALALVALSVPILIVAGAVRELHGLWIVFWLTAVFLPVRLPEERWPARILSLARIAAALMLLFSVRPLDLRADFKAGFAESHERLARLASEEAFRPQGSQMGPLRKLIEDEHAKAIAEIKPRGEQEDTWFKYKFGLVGTLLVGITFFKLRESHGSASEGRQTLRQFFDSPTIAAALAAACVVALACDIHIRSNMCVVSQLGLWIAHYAEPALSGHAVAPREIARFLPWEQFLRAAPPGGDGMHGSEIWSLSFWPRFHFLTAMLYLVYAFLIQHLSLYPEAWRSAEGGTSTACHALVAGSVFVHAGFFVLAWVAHAAPGAFEYRVVPFVEGSAASGVVAPLAYLIPWAALVWQQGKYLRRLLEAA